MFIIVFIGIDEFGDFGFGIFKMKFLNGVLIWWYGGIIFGFLIFVGGIFGGKYILVVNLNSFKVDIFDFFKNILFVEFSK